MSALPDSPFVSAGKTGRETAITSAHINARAYVRHSDCTRVANVVHLTLTCTSVPSAAMLFAALARATKAGEVSVSLPAAPNQAGAAP